MSAIVASGGGLSNWIGGIRLSLHILAATVWVGGQFTLAGLVPAARALGPEAPKVLARAFARLMWPAYALLVATGIWNVVAISAGQPPAWKAVLGIKMTVVLAAGLSAFLHSRATTERGLALWGSLSGIAAVTALVLGVFLAG
jgi:putative copper export protein